MAAFLNNDAFSTTLLGKHLAESCSHVDFSICWNNSSEETTLNMVKRKIEMSDGAFYMMDLGRVASHYHRWIRLLPRVKPFFAIKCNPDDMVIGLLMALGAGFDCASQGEIEVIRTHLERYLALQKNDDEESAATTLRDYLSKNVIYANPIKLRTHMRSARDHGVQWTTFDSIVELRKIAKEWPDAKLVLRIIPPRIFKAAVQFEGKFGACSGEIPSLLATAKELSLDIVGVSFHVGSGCDDVYAWSETLIYAKKIFNLMQNFGFSPYLLDLGGGFHGVTAFPTSNTDSEIAAFEKSCELVNNTLDEHFPSHEDYLIIAEPGRYFVEAAFTLATKVIGKHSIQATPTSLEVAYNNYSQMTIDEMNHIIKNEEEHVGICDMIDSKEVPCIRYYVDDSVYGSFSCNTYDIAATMLCYFHVDKETGELHKLDSKSPLYPSKIYGATCDSADCIRKCSSLPALTEGDWIVWRDAGAYWKASGCPFNGIPLPPVYYYVCCDQLNLLPDVAASVSLFHGQEVVLSSEGGSSEHGNEELPSGDELQFDEIIVKNSSVIHAGDELNDILTEKMEAPSSIHRVFNFQRRMSCSLEEVEGIDENLSTQFPQEV